MRTRMKVAICISLSFLCLFTLIGYAKLSRPLYLEGNADIDPPEPKGLFISAVEIYSMSGVSSAEESITLPTSIQSKLNVSARNATVTYKITVSNKTDLTYWYLGTKYEKDGSNALINTTGGITITTTDGASTDSTAFNTYDWVPPQTDRVFYATYIFGANAQGHVSTLVNFSFGLTVSSVSDAFLKVLNDKVSDFGYYYLADAFDENYAESESKVLGNVGTDKEIFTNLFGPSITVNVNGVNVPATFLVERRNVDGKSNTGDRYDGNGAPSGCEYTVYVTVEDLNNPGGTATVYAVSYTCDSSGVWYMIGELYEGTCQKTDYDSTTKDYEGGFDVTTWTATQKEYTVINNVTYKVGYTQQGTEYDRYTTIEQLMSKFDQEFYNKVNNNSATFLQTVCKTLYSYHHNNGPYIESVNAANVANPGYADLKRAFDRIKPYCLIANGAQEVKLQNANTLSRAELIQILEDIQKSYEYYLAVNA